jgi:hypothetical protein
MTAMRTPRTRQGGQSMTDYIVIGAVMITVLFVPFGGKPSVVDQVIEAFRDYYANYSYPTSLP